MLSHSLYSLLFDKKRCYCEILNGNMRLTSHYSFSFQFFLMAICWFAMSGQAHTVSSVGGLAFSAHTAVCE